MNLEILLKQSTKKQEKKIYMCVLCMCDRYPKM